MQIDVNGFRNINILENDIPTEWYERVLDYSSTLFQKENRILQIIFVWREIKHHLIVSTDEDIVLLSKVA